MSVGVGGMFCVWSVHTCAYRGCPARSLSVLLLWHGVSHLQPASPRHPLGWLLSHSTGALGTCTCTPSIWQDARDLEVCYILNHLPSLPLLFVKYHFPLIRKWLLFFHDRKRGKHRKKNVKKIKTTRKKKCCHFIPIYVFNVFTHRNLYLLYKSALLKMLSSVSFFSLFLCLFLAWR